MAVEYKYVNEKSFINPYNFVPSDFKTVSRGTAPACGEKVISGYLDCSLTTRTPLAIPDTSEASEDMNGHRTYPFMNINGKVYIPGSSIRGVIRNIYETVTDSCYSTVDASSHISYRTKDAFLPGLLIKKDGQYRVVSAERYIIPITGRDYKPIDTPAETFSIRDYQLKEYRFAQEVFIKPHDKSYSKHGRHVVGTYIKDISLTSKAGYRKGYICIGEKFSRKHFESVFVAIENGDTFTVSKTHIDEYFDVLNIYNDPSVNKAAKADAQNIYHDRLMELEENHPYPVWYRADGELLYLSPAQLGRTEFARSMGDIIGRKKPCTDKQNLCAACSLFGMVGRADNSVASRVRFSDAEAVGTPEADFFILRELGSPHPSYIPFYGYSDSGRLSYDNNTLDINGRKFYWHIAGAASDKGVYSLPESNESITKRNSTMELVPAASRFTFRVFYDSISEEEFKSLVWALALGENTEDSDMCQKIGHGKPLGLGSVKICVVSDNRRTFESGNYRIEKLEVTCDDDFAPKADDDTMDALKTISSFSFCKDYDVRYPYVVGATAGEKGNVHASHQWFTKNWKLGRENPDTFLEPVPAAGDAEIMTMHPVKCDDEQGKKRKGMVETVRVYRMASNGRFVQFNFDDRSRGSANANGKAYSNGELLKVRVKGYNEQFRSYDCDIL